MTSSLITGRYVIPKVQESGDAQMLQDGAIFQSDGVIVDVGDYAALHAQYPDAEVIGGAEFVVIPGLVNSHHHGGFTPLQLGTIDANLETWSAKRLGSPVVDPYLDTVYGALQMLHSGTTTVQHLQGRLVGPSENALSQSEEVLRGYCDVGMRVNFAVGIRDQNHLFHIPDPISALHLPRSVTFELAELTRKTAMPLEEQMALFTHLKTKWINHTKERIQIQLAPTNLHWCTDEALARVADRARHERVRIHMHLLETVHQREYAKSRTGGDIFGHLRSLGLLGAQLTLAHLVWVTEQEIELICDSEAIICHNASSNLRLGSGIAPVSDFLHRGIPVCIGVDEAGINDNHDILQELRLALSLHNFHGAKRRIDTADVFRMATEWGGEASGFSCKVGTLEAGSTADIVLLRWDLLVDPFVHPDLSVLEVLLRRGNPDAVDTVIIGGRAVLKAGAVVSVDERGILEAIRSRAPRWQENSSLRRLGNKLQPYLSEHYRERSEETKVGPPYYDVNARS